MNTDNPHAMDPDRFYRALRNYLAASPADVEILPPIPGLTGICRTCGYDDDQPPTRYQAATDAARALVAVAKVKAALDAGWDGTSGCWGRQSQPVALAKALRRHGARGPAPRLLITGRPIR